tara:strand:+ start:953 stop:2065 length:1113 start_codon:yes stop_codon:yes gene_type:complete
MATINNIINVNSSWSKDIVSPALTQASIKVWIYSGEQGVSAISGVELIASNGRLLNPTYSLSGTAISYDSTSAISFEISPLIKDYLESNLANDTYNSDNAIWVDIQVTSTINAIETISASEHYLALDGYEYTIQDSTDDVDNVIRMSNRKIQYLKDSGLKVPVLRQGMVSYYFKKDGVTLVSGVVADFADSDLSDEQLIYLENSVDGINYLEVDSLEITYDNGFDIITLSQVEECKYQPRKLTFVNKFGAFQDVWMFKNADRTLEVKKDTWNRRNPIIGSSINRPNTLVGIQTINEKITLNSGFYSEDENVIFEELMQSKNVWMWSLDSTPRAQAILIKDGSFNFKDSVTEKVINYTLNIEYAFSKIKAL